MREINLLYNKSRVAPEKITIPRLELCGDPLLAKLIKKLIDALKVDISQVFLNIDSKIILA